MKKNIKSDDDDYFVIINFRGTHCFLGKDTIEMLPYLNALVNGPLKGSQIDENGYLKVGEASTYIYLLVDLYRAWMQEGCPRFMFNCNGILNYMVILALAQRMGCKKKFINAMRRSTKKLINNDNNFRCYYCHNVFSLDEKLRECKYHDKNCNCRDFRRFGCCRIPCHSAKAIELAVEPISFEDYCKNK